MCLCQGLRVVGALFSNSGLITLVQLGDFGETLINDGRGFQSQSSDHTLNTCDLAATARGLHY
jgi:hypothetical protein